MEPEDIADRLLAAHDTASLVETISETVPTFGQADAYAVLDVIAQRRRASGWQPVGRKVGFTNRTIWEIYGVHAPMWAHVWDRTVIRADGGAATLALDAFVQPRIEPEVVVGVRDDVPVTDDAAQIMRHVDWIAAGFEIVHCHFADWRFALADCTADFGLHGALVVGERVAVDAANYDTVAATLASFEVTLSCGGEVVATGCGANVLGSPALALGYLAEVIASDSHAPPLTPGELVTTGTLTDAQPIAAGQTWTSDYGELALPGLTLTLA